MKDFENSQDADQFLSLLTQKWGWSVSKCTRR
jgi:hypothetical protein